MRPALHVVAGLLLAACSLTTSFDDLTTTVTSTEDAGTDAAPRAADASGDRATSGGPCDGLPETTRFCTGFDDAPLNEAWDDRQTDRGVVSADTGAFVSAPRSLLSATEPVSTSGSSPRSYVVKRFPDLAGRAARFTLRLAMSIEQTDPDREAVLASFQLEGESGEHAFQIVARMGTEPGTVRVELIEQDVSNSTVGSARLGCWPAAPGAWARVEIEVTLRDPAGGGNAWRVTVEGVPTPTSSFTTSVSGGVPLITAGLSWARTPAGVWRARYDDVSLDVAPVD